MNANKTLTTGNLLVAEPFMLDPYFKRSVVLVCENKPEGILGFILNKPLNMTLNSLLGNFPEFNAEVYFGGPVQRDTIHFIHDLGDMLEGSKKVAEGIYWGGDFEKLKFMISSKLVTPKNIRFFVGYTGWSIGQLNDELDMKSWIISGSTTKQVFKPNNLQDLWGDVLKNKGNYYSVIAEIPNEVCWN